jgi:hypothetical protein
LSNIGYFAHPHFCSRYRVVVASTPNPYLMLRDSEIDEDSGSYRVGQETSPVLNPK